MTLFCNRTTWNTSWDYLDMKLISNRSTGKTLNREGLDYLLEDLKASLFFFVTFGVIVREEDVSKLRNKRKHLIS